MSEAATRSLPPVPTSAWMKPLPPATRFILHGGPAARTAATHAWGAAFAEKSCRAVAQNGRATLWLGPDEYLLLDGVSGGDGESAMAAAQALEGALNGIPHALVDIGHRQFALEVSGPHATEILSGACPLDLDLTEFPVGMCTRTVLAKADIVLWRTREEVFHIEVWRSFGGYVTGLLSEIAMEFYE